MTNKKHAHTAWRPVIITAVLVFLYLPLVLVALYSFSESKVAGVMKGFTWDWYAKLMRDAAMGQALRTSLRVAAFSCLISAPLATLGAIGLAAREAGKSRLAKLASGARGLVEGVTVLPVMLPEVVLGMSLMAAFSMVGMRFGIWTLVAAHTTFCVPYVYLIVKSRLAGLDPQLAEAARDLGAKPARAFLDVTLPLILPAVVSGMLLAVAMSFDDVIISMFVNGAQSTTLPLKIFSSLRAGVTPEINALCTITLGVVCLIVALSQVLRGPQGATEEHTAET
ncbi:putrescine ABC transporter permease PotI [Clostridia bacterium]|nr:putrescine ABC transporter permease PotI [Clostridia bacterium]